MASRGPLQGKIVCFTGRLTRVRKVAKEELKKAGGIFASAISSRVDIVVAGDDAGSKLDDAERLNIDVWNEDEFNKALEGVSPKRKKRKRSRSNSPSDSPKKKKRKVTKKKQRQRAQKDDRPKCKYASDCYQTSAQHKKDFYHPPKCFDEFSSDDDKDKNKNTNDHSANDSDAKHESDSNQKQENDEDGDVEIRDDVAENEEDEIYSDNDVDAERRDILEQMWKARLDAVNDNLKDIPRGWRARIKGHNVALTGWFPVTRSDLIRLITICGGRITADVNDDCQLLIVGERPGMKLFEANESGVNILYYTEISKMLNINKSDVNTSSIEY